MIGQLDRRCVSGLLLFFAVALCVESVAAADLAAQRQAYAHAIQALEQRDWETYEPLRARLEDYPLAIYLDYFKLAHQDELATPGKARRFLATAADTPLANRYLGSYLRQAGKAGRWQDFLAVNPDEPNSVDLKCYYLRARLAQGDADIAWDGAAALWVHGQSRPGECDPLFQAWQSAGGLTDELVWARLLNAFDARQLPLLQYVARSSSASLKPWADKLLAVYNDPGALAGVEPSEEIPYPVDIVSHGVAHLARYNPSSALSLWRDFSGRMRFTPEQVQAVEYAIAQQALFARDASLDDWLTAALARLGDDKLVGIRLRWALSEEDWTAVAHYLSLLSSEGQDANVWRYWRAVVLEQAGESDAATALLRQLAAERDYYGFLAADRLALPYAFNHQRPEINEDSPVTNFPAIGRIEELKFHGESMLAQAEWYKLLQDTTIPEQQNDLMLLASEKGWYRMAIDAATRAGAWDALDQRFPTAYQGIFKQYAANRGVPWTELMSIARRESAFYPGAESPVGARGLMQIMPATGREVAASLKVPHVDAKLFDVEHSVQLGSAYYRQLLDKFDDNRIFALTAYNAGPHRVARWRHRAGEGVPVDVWIETIPYLETRNYVQAVLAYNVVFQYLLGDAQHLLTPAERQARY